MLLNLDTDYFMISVVLFSLVIILLFCVYSRGKHIVQNRTSWMMPSWDCYRCSDTQTGWLLSFKHSGVNDICMNRTILLWLFASFKTYALLNSKITRDKCRIFLFTHVEIQHKSLFHYVIIFCSCWYLVNRL